MGWCGTRVGVVGVKGRLDVPVSAAECYSKVPSFWVDAGLQINRIHQLAKNLVLLQPDNSRKKGLSSGLDA